MFTHGAGCNAHCHDTVHAFLLLTEVTPPLSALIRYAIACDVQFLGVYHLTDGDVEPVVALLTPGMQAWRVVIKECEEHS
jgi:hypothetical protein